MTRYYNQPDSVPEDPVQLYGSYLPHRGLLVSKVFKGGSAIFSTKSYCTRSTTCENDKDHAPGDAASLTLTSAPSTTSLLSRSEPQVCVS